MTIVASALPFIAEDFGISPFFFSLSVLSLSFCFCRFGGGGVFVCWG